MRKLKSKRKKKVSTIDPFCNVASRREMVAARKNLLNEAPLDPDDQPMTKKLQELVKVMERQKNHSQKKKVKRLQSSTVEPLTKTSRRKKKNPKHQDTHEEDDSDTEIHVHVNPREDKDTDKLTRFPGESDKKFLRRVRTEADQEIRSQVNKIHLLGKHQKDVLEKTEKKKVSNRDKERLQKLKDKKKNKKIEKKIDRLEDQYFKDKVEFGETAPRPPELSFQPRKSQESGKAGQRKLLLTSLMERGASQSQSQVAKSSAQKKTTQQHKFKRRKDMDKGEKRQFDKMRQDAIVAYRQAKAEAMAQRTSNQ